MANILSAAWRKSGTEASGNFWVFGFEGKRVEDFERPPLFLEGSAPFFGRLFEGVEKAFQIRDGFVNPYAAIKETPKPVLHQTVLA